MHDDAPHVVAFGRGLDRDAWRYGADRRPNWMAMGASAAFAALLLFALTELDMISVQKTPARTTVVEMLEDAPPPPPPAAPQPQERAEATPIQPAIVAPQSLVSTITPPVEIPATPLPAAPPAVVRAQPSPAPAAVAPAIENAGDLSSKMIEARAPRYPMDSRRKHEEGTVVLSLLLGTDGRVTEISIARSSGFERLDRAALEAVRRWRWSPTRRGGAPVMVRGVVEIPFELTRG